MQQYRSKRGPFEIELRFTPEEIDELCVEALAAAKLMPDGPQPIRIERFIEKHFETTPRYEDMGQGVLGCTIFNAKGRVEAVVISNRFDDGTKTSERRLFSTLAHEAGHGLMHASLFLPSLDQGRLPSSQPTNHENLDFSKRRILCRETDVRDDGAKGSRYDGRWWEWQANRAIGSLLLPRRLVRAALIDFLEISPVTKLPTLASEQRVNAERHIADVFDVNPVVARIRLSEMFPDAGGQLTF